MTLNLTHTFLRVKPRWQVTRGEALDADVTAVWSHLGVTTRGGGGSTPDTGPTNPTCGPENSTESWACTAPPPINTFIVDSKGEASAGDVSAPAPLRGVNAKKRL